MKSEKNKAYISSESSLTERFLDNQLAVSLIGRETPHELVADRHGISFIRFENSKENDRDKEKVAAIRKINISFNPLHKPRALDGLCQLPQLRQLFVYSCGLQHPDCLACLSSIPKLEILLAHQNFIPAIPDTCRSLSKLQELRLDRNRITKIEHLQSCSSLRKLDLSTNLIQSLEGISGLQSLQELKISSNAIDSLLPCKALPSLRELDVSYNHLVSLEGVQQLPLLEALRADHNSIASLQLLTPTQTGPKKKAAANASSSSSTTSSLTKGSQPPPKKGAPTSSATSEKKSSEGLTELYLSGNKLVSLDGLDGWARSLELLDVSENLLAGSALQPLLGLLPRLQQLGELRLHGNPLLECGPEKERAGAVAAQIAAVCPSIRAVDGRSFVSSDDAGSSAEGDTILAPSRKREEGEARGAGLEEDEEEKKQIGFHTWERGSQVSGSVAETDPKPVRSRAFYQSDSDSDGDSLSGPAPPPAPEEPYSPRVHDAGEALIAAPRLTLQSLLTPQQIVQLESRFTDLLAACKASLATAATSSSVFAFAADSKQLDDGGAKEATGGAALEDRLRSLLSETTSAAAEQKEKEAQGVAAGAVGTSAEETGPRQEASSSESKADGKLDEEAVEGSAKADTKADLAPDLDRVRRGRDKPPLARKAPNPVHAELGSGLSRHGSKLNKQQPGRRLASEDQEQTLLASQLETVRITRRDPKMFLTSSHVEVTITDTSLLQSSPIPGQLELPPQESEPTKVSGFKRFAASLDPRSTSEGSSSRLVSPIQEDQREDEEEEEEPPQIKGGAGSLINDSDEDSDGSLASVMQEAADAILGRFTPRDGPREEAKQQGAGSSDGEESEEEGVIKVVNLSQLSPFTGAGRSGAAVVQGLGTPRGLQGMPSPAGKSIVPAATSTQLRKFRIPNGAQAAIRDSLDTNSLPAGKDGEGQATTKAFSHNNSAPQLK